MHICATLSAWSSRYDYLDPCQLHDIGFPMYMIRINMLTCTMYIGVKPYRCAITHQTWNSARFSPFKWGTFVAIFSQQKLGDIVFCVLWRIWGEMLSDFRRGNLATIPNVLAKHWLRPHPFQNQTDNSLILRIYIIIKKYYHNYVELIRAFYSWFWNNAK